MQSPTVKILVAAITLGFCLCAEIALADYVPPDPYPSDAVRSYDPVSENAQADLGQMRLSKTFASFSELRGHMDLEFAGTLPDSREEMVSGAHVYKIRNADRYFEQNKNARGFCHRKVYWLALRMEPVRWVDQPDQPSDMVWVTQIIEPEFAKITRADVCMGSVFGLSHEK